MEVPMNKVFFRIALLWWLTALFTGCSKPSVYNGGTYRAAATGYGGDLTVEVEFDGASILSVKVVEHNETKGFGDLAAGELPEKMVAAQTYEVDGYSSATITGDAIKAAVKDCIEQAKNK
jgi:fumarate reductase flavoprotein subunit